MIADLSRPEAYPHPCEPIRCIETHISWVLLTGPYAYKIRKPVDLGFVDFSDLDKRTRDCEDELRLNRRFAPELYRAVVPIYRGADGRASFVGDGEVIEHAVQMVQFDPQQQLDHLVERDAISRAELASFGRALATVHRELPRAQGGDAWAPVEGCFEVLEASEEARELLPTVRAVRQWALDRHASLAGIFEARAAGGFVRECHGDLHLSNMVRTETGIRAFDCLEFNEALRSIDVMADVAFLQMDCSVRDRDDLAYAFLDGYLGESGDLEGARLLPFYAVYRSLVRAKVAALQGGRLERLRLHVEWATRYVDRPRGRTILMCGLSGSGKSWVAERLVARLGALRLRSDAIRKTGDAPVSYDAAAIDAVYRRMERLAATLADAGEHVVVDATFLTRAERARFEPDAIVWCRAGETTLRDRILERDPRDPSDATVAVLEGQLPRFEPPSGDEPVVELDTESPDLERQIERLERV